MTPEQKQRLVELEANGCDLLPRRQVIERIEKQIRLWSNDTVTMACADMLADLKQMPAFDAATAMRSACVEKVKAMAADVEHGDALLSAKAVIKKSESLSIEKSQERTRE